MSSIGNIRARSLVSRRNLRWAFLALFVLACDTIVATLAWLLVDLFVGPSLA
jgi:hypothetical protein